MIPRAAWRTLGRTVATIGAGTLGGWIASLIGLPLPWMMGSLIMVATLAIGRVEIVGHGVYVPLILRNAMVPVIGVMLGSSFTPEIAGQMAEWWITLLGVLVYVVSAAGAVYLLYRRCFGLDRATAYFAAIPGGLMEMSVLGEQSGGDARTISLIHFCRIVIAVLSIPFVMRFLYGPVGSSALASSAAEWQIEAVDLAILLLCAVIGLAAGRLVRLPGAVISGPLLASAAVHITGITEASPPLSLILAAQIVIGAALGARFAGFALGRLIQLAGAALAASAMMLAIMILFALALAPFVVESFTAVVLAYAPGGFAEMSLIALTLNIGIAFVAAHHLARILIAVSLMPALWRLIGGRDSQRSV